jgi:hypothetical protein
VRPQKQKAPLFRGAFVPGAGTLPNTINDILGWFDIASA